MSETQRFIFPLKVMQWNTLATSDGRPLTPGDGMKAAGYIPVYDNIQTLVDDHGTDQEYGTFERRNND